MWTYPVRPPIITSPFNPARRHPVTGVVQPHTGVDYRAPMGTPLYAAHAGTVVRSSFDAQTAGNYVRIDVGGGVWIGYSHLSYRPVRVGQRVSAGEAIGRSGDTGSATGAHLHFEVSVDGTKVDPVPFLAARVGGLVDNPGPTVPTPPTVPTAPTAPTPIPEADIMASMEELDELLSAHLYGVARTVLPAYKIDGGKAYFRPIGDDHREWLSGNKWNPARFEPIPLPPTDTFWARQADYFAEVYRLPGTEAGWGIGAHPVTGLPGRTWLPYPTYVAMGSPVVTELPAGHPFWLLPTYGELPT
jgi:murein DD-endopeptidase MepM/ murein hydrolase activator NlpD